MADLERKKLEVQLKKIEAAIAELELKREERFEEIKRIEDHIKLQLETKIKIETELKKA